METTDIMETETATGNAGMDKGIPGIHITSIIARGMWHGMPGLQEPPELVCGPGVPGIHALTGRPAEVPGTREAISALREAEQISLTAPGAPA